MRFSALSALRPVLPIMVFLAYVVSIAWFHDVQKSNWQLEKEAGIPVAISYIYYHRPFGSIDTGIYESLQRLGPQGSVDVFLSDVVQQKILPAGTIPTTTDGTGLGYARFTTASLFVFGPHTVALVLGFAAFLGISVLAFLLRFQDDRTLAIPALFISLTLMLLTAYATHRFAVDQAPIGGYRFFVIAGILPTIHIILELFDSTEQAAKSATDVLLLGLQFALLLFVASVRMSATYLIGAVTFGAILSIWIRRNDVQRRGAVLKKAAILLVVALMANVSGRFFTPDAYGNLGLSSEAFWHRAFISLGANPDWPFGNLAVTFDCKPNMPNGLVPGITDSNGHCAYNAAVLHGADEGPTYGGQYEKILRAAFFQVAYEYPRQVLETYALYKPLLIWETLSLASKPSISRQTAPIMIPLAVQLVLFVIMICWPPDRVSRLREICGAFAVVAAFSVAPQLFAWSALHTSTDLICYMYVALGLFLAAAGRRMLPRRYLSPCLRSGTLPTGEVGN
jgi:hypothetical protein